MKKKERRFDFVSPYYEEIGSEFRRMEILHRDSDWNTFKDFLDSIPSGHLKQMLQSLLAKKASTRKELLETKALLINNPGVEEYINRRLGIRRKTSV